MRILNIIQGTGLGGMEQASLRLMAGLKKRGHSCHVLSLTPIGGLGELLEKHGISFEGLPYSGRGGWRSFSLLRTRIRTLSGDALLMTGQNLLAMHAFGGLCRGRRVLAIHFHHTGVKPPWVWRLIYRQALRQFQVITFPSEFIRQEAVALYPPVARIGHLVRNPLFLPDVAEIPARNAARGRLGISSSAAVIGNAGWLIHRKRFDIFLTVAKRIAQAIPEAQFVVAGDGPECQRLKALAAELGIGQSVHWLGWRQDLSDFYSCLDVLLFNSDWDAMGMTPLEAMAYRVPVVASVCNGGLAEVIDSCTVGFLFNDHTVDELTDAVIRLVQDPALRDRVAEAGRKRAEEVGNPDLCVSAYEALLERAGP